MTLRDARPGDGHLIHSLVSELAEYERLLHEVEATPESLERELFAENSVIRAIVAEVEGVGVGFALYFYNFSTFLAKRGIYLEDLYVKPEWRGKGIGKALLLELARRADNEGCGRLEWSVLDWNEPAIEFYHSLGSIAMSEWTVHRVTGEALSALAQRSKQDQSRAKERS